MNSLAKQHLHINPTLGTFRGGSLPNVNHVASNTVENKVGNYVWLGSFKYYILGNFFIEK